MIPCAGAARSPASSPALARTSASLAAASAIDAAARRVRPASTGPTWRNRPRLPCSAWRRRCARRTRVVDELGDRSTGATQVSAGASSATHSSRSRVANAARRSARISSWRASSIWCAIHCSQPSARHRFAQNVRLDRADREPLAVARRVDVVAGVAAGEDVVARARLVAGREVLVDRRATSATARRRRPTRRGTRPRRCARAAQQRGQDRDRRVHAAGRAVGDRRARQRRAAVGAAARAVRGSRRPPGS